MRYAPHPRTTIIAVECKRERPTLPLTAPMRLPWPPCAREHFVHGGDDALPMPGSTRSYVCTYGSFWLSLAYSL